jgi:histidinol-phosphate aminotransferase
MFGIEAVRAFARALAPATLLVDETYAAFAGEDCLRLAFEEPNVVVSRTFSKAWSLAGLRVGVLVGPAPMIEALDKVKDSYNVDVLAQTIAEAALSDPEWMQANARRLAATRDRFSAALREKGWDVAPSRTNFVWCRPPEPKTAEQVQAKVRNWGFLIRRFPDDPRFSDRLRISMGTDEEMDELLGYL